MRHAEMLNVVTRLVVESSKHPALPWISCVCMSTRDSTGSAPLPLSEQKSRRTFSPTLPSSLRTESERSSLRFSNPDYARFAVGHLDHVGLCCLSCWLDGHLLRAIEPRRHSPISSIGHDPTMRSRRLDATSNNQVLDDMCNFQHHSCTPKESECSFTTGRCSWTQNRSVGKLPDSIHCTFVTTVTETLRRVDDGTPSTGFPHPREHNINTVVACSKLATIPQSVHLSLRATTSRSIVSQSIERHH